MQRSAWALITLFVGSFWGCETLDPEVPVPSYIHIDQFTVDNNLSDYKIYSEKITDVWVYLDNEAQGAYELPAEFPLNASGAHKITLRPGIKNGGVATARATYPFYAAGEYPSINLLAGQSITLSPVTYYDDVQAKIQIPWSEDFEGLGGTDVTYHPTSDTVITFVTDPEIIFTADGGISSGAVFLAGNDNYFEMISPTFNNLPLSNVPIYLELDYKTNHQFLVGMYTNNQTTLDNLYTIKAKDSWNKIYLDMTYFVQTHSQSFNFNIYIAVIKSTGEEDVEMYIDNLKLLHYP